MKLYVIISVIFIMCYSPLKAHGDLDLRIEAITSLIETFPDSASLYFNRGKLRFQHEEYQASIDDINLSISKGSYNELQNIYLAKSLFKLNQYQESLIKLSLFLADDPRNVVALNLKARIFYAQNKFEESALYFEEVIHLTIRSLPENYLEAANSWSASNNPNKYAKAINILELGIKNLGPIITLQDKIIETHLQNNNKEKAIETQMAIIEKTKRKESALFKLAEMYERLGEHQNAVNAAEMANSHLDKLPLRIQKNAAMKILRDKIQKLINKL